jgi:hypothetical protein
MIDVEVFKMTSGIFGMVTETDTGVTLILAHKNQAWTPVAGVREGSPLPVPPYFSLAPYIEQRLDRTLERK